jgi:hypothetical protein
MITTATLFQWVEINQDVPNSLVKKGDKGVVLDYLQPTKSQPEAGYNLEVFKDGETIDVISVPISWVTPLPEIWGTAPKLTFKYGWDEKDEVETLRKGCRSDGIVSLSDGTTYSVYFIDPVRLQQDLEEEVELGSPFLAPPGLIVIPELTRSAMENAIAQLWKRGYFDALKPLAEVKESHQVA